MAALLFALPYLKKYGLWLALAVALLLGWHVAAVHYREQGRRESAATIAALNQTIADVRTATAKAQADDAAHAKAVETAQSQITETSNATLEKQLAAARADAAAYAQRLRQQSQAGAGGGQQQDLSAVADAASGPAGDGQAAELDAAACAESVTKAQGWQDWWKDVAAVPR